MIINRGVIEFDFKPLMTENKFMQIENIPLQMNIQPLEQILVDAQAQGTDLAEKMLKMSSLQQIDQSQLGYIGTIIDLYV